MHTLNTDTFHVGSELREIEVVKGKGNSPWKQVVGSRTSR